MMFGTTTACPTRMRPSAVSSAGNGTVARSRCSLSNGQNAGLAVSSDRSGRVDGWSFTPVRIRALAPVSGSRRQRSRTRVQAPPAARSGTLASRSRSSKSIAVTLMTVAGWAHAGRSCSCSDPSGTDRGFPGRNGDQCPGVTGRARRAAVRHHPGSGRPGARGACRGLPGRRRLGGAQGDAALCGVAGHGGRHDGRPPAVGPLLGRVPGEQSGLGERLAVAVSFEFATAGRIMVGPGRAQELPGVLAGLGSRVLVVTGADPARHNTLLASLDRAAAMFPVAAEPTVDLVRAAVAVARAQGADVIAAIGGGSVIDTGKAVAMLLGNGGDPLDYLEVVGSGQAITRPSVPCVAVPTTAGTGAEVTANAVLAVPSHRVKASLRSPLMIPRVALVDPLLTVSCPPTVTAASGLDALTQCLEPFVSVQATPLTDGLAREGLRRAGTGLRAAYANGEDLAARADMAMCSLLGGISLANAKLGAVHGLAGVIGGTADVPHGLACAALLAPVIEANVRTLRSAGAGPSADGVLDRYAEAARLLTGHPAASLEDGLAWIRETLTLLHVPGLASFGLRPAQFDDIATQAMASSSMKGNPVTLSHADLTAILSQAGGG